VALAGPALVYNRGRYYPAEGTQGVSAGERQRIERVASRLIRHYQSAASRQERRRENRVNFVQPVEVLTEDGRTLTVLSRDLSLTGLRLIASQSLLGQKIQVVLPGEGRDAPHRFLVRILWACAVGDGLFENGALFLDTFPEQGEGLRLVTED
jgi:hypothetical protein